MYEMLSDINSTKLRTDGLFLNADAGIERTDAWLDAFKAILVRFETKIIHWKA